MSTLQITMVIIWAGIAFGFVYSIGSAFGKGWEAVGQVIGTICVYGAAWALLYFTFKAIFG